jgi:hypothetical protein
MRSAPFFEPDPSGGVLGPSLAGKRPKTDQHVNLYSSFRVRPLVSVFCNPLSHKSRIRTVWTWTSVDVTVLGEPGQGLNRVLRRFQWVFNGVLREFWRGCTLGGTCQGSEIDHFGGLGGPGRPGDPSKGWGASPPTFWKGLWGHRGRPDAHNDRGQGLNDQWAWVHVSAVANPKCTEVLSRISEGQDAVAVRTTVIQRFGAMDVTKPYEFIGFGAMDATRSTFKIEDPYPGPRRVDCRAQDERFLVRRGPGF